MGRSDWGDGYNNSMGRPGLLVLDIETGESMVSGDNLEVATGSGDNGLGQIEGSGLQQKRQYRLNFCLRFTRQCLEV